MLFLHAVCAAEKRLVNKSCTIEKRDGRKLSVDEFNDRFAIPGKPVILTGIWTADGSDFMKSFKRLVNEYRLQDEGAEFLRQSPTSLMLSVETISDHNINSENQSTRKAFKQEFVVPRFFRQNALFNPSCIQDKDFLSGYQYRWLLLGGKGGGSGWHFDPFNTSAWNVVHSGGSKRWAMYPGSTLPPTVPSPAELDRSMKWAPWEERYTAYIGGGYSGVGADEWFDRVLPSLPPAQQPMHCTVGVGEVIFVPGGWWHAVQNLGDSVAYTQNLVVAHPQHVNISALAMGDQVARLKKKQARGYEEGDEIGDAIEDEIRPIVKCHAALVALLQEGLVSRGGVSGGGQTEEKREVGMLAEGSSHERREAISEGKRQEGRSGGDPVKIEGPAEGLSMQEEQQKQKERRRQEQKKRRRQEQQRWQQRRRHEEGQELEQELQQPTKRGKKRARKKRARDKQKSEGGHGEL
jgi:hypothetical protein